MIKLSLKNIKESFVIIVLAVLIAFAVNVYHPMGFVFVDRSFTQGRMMVKISSEEAKVKYDASSAIFIDSRDEEEYNEAHILGSINIPAGSDMLSYKDGMFNIDALNKPLELVVYCDGVTCGAAELLAKEILDMGYKNHIYIIRNGLPEWDEMKYPVEKR